MRARYGSERWRVTAATALAAVLAFALISAVPLAFAEEDPSEVAVEAPDDDGEGESNGEDSVALASTFRLGDVRLSVVAQDADAAGLALGAPVERTYVVTNEGERAYVRLSSMVSYGDLAQPSRLGVRDEPLRESGEELDEPSADDEAASSAEVSVWYLGDGDRWYRNEPLERGERIVVHVVVEVPRDDVWREALTTGAPSGIDEVVRVEAVQARNMKVNADAEHPWGDVEVEILDNGAMEGTDPEVERGDEA